MHKLKIILVDNNFSFRIALKTLLENQYKAHIIGEYKNATELLSNNCFQFADVILLDIMLPEINGIDLTRKILWENNKLKIVAIAQHIDKLYLISLIEAGFVGCISKNNLGSDLEPALQAVMSGNLYFSDAIPLSQKKNQFD